MNKDTETRKSSKPRHRSFFLNETLHGYITDHCTQPDEIQKSLIEETTKLGQLAFMQIGTDQGAFLSILVNAIRPRFAIEVGTFTGYSSLAIARSLPNESRLLCCDISEEWTSIARRYWEMAGLSNLIDLKIGPALETLSDLPKETELDFAFIDADKGSYIKYYEALVPFLTQHGMIVVDNVLWSGRVINTDISDNDTRAIRSFNDHIIADKRVSVVMLSIGDGLTLIRRSPD